jgi:hypothetical protein
MSHGIFSTTRMYGKASIFIWGWDDERNNFKSVRMSVLLALNLLSYTTCTYNNGWGMKLGQINNYIHVHVYSQKFSSGENFHQFHHSLVKTFIHEF